MEEACRQATRLQEAGLKKLSINLSPRSFTGTGWWTT